MIRNERSQPQQFHIQLVTPENSQPNLEKEIISSLKVMMQVPDREGFLTLVPLDSCDINISPLDKEILGQPDITLQIKDTKGKDSLHKKTTKPKRSSCGPNVYNVEYVSATETVTNNVIDDTDHPPDESSHVGGESANSLQIGNLMSPNRVKDATHLSMFLHFLKCKNISLDLIGTSQQIPNNTPKDSSVIDIIQHVMPSHALKDSPEGSLVTDVQHHQLSAKTINDLLCEFFTLLFCTKGHNSFGKGTVSKGLADILGFIKSYGVDVEVHPECCEFKNGFIIPITTSSKSHYITVQNRSLSIYALFEMYLCQNGNKTGVIDMDKQKVNEKLCLFYDIYLTGEVTFRGKLVLPGHGTMIRRLKDLIQYLTDKGFSIMEDDCFHSFRDNKIASYVSTLKRFMSDKSEMTKAVKVDGIIKKTATHPQQRPPAKRKLSTDVVNKTKSRSSDEKQELSSTIFLRFQSVLKAKGLDLELKGV